MIDVAHLANESCAILTGKQLLSFPDFFTPSFADRSLENVSHSPRVADDHNRSPSGI